MPLNELYRSYDLILTLGFISDMLTFSPVCVQEPITKSHVCVSYGQCVRSAEQLAVCREGGTHRTLPLLCTMQIVGRMYGVNDVSSALQNNILFSWLRVCYMPEDRTLHSHCCEHLKSSIKKNIWRKQKKPLFAFKIVAFYVSAPFCTYIEIWFLFLNMRN
jgi:hypothetical protein